jgi:hypothetical protein
MAMDWNSNDNPWGPGGRYHKQLPWANQGVAGMQHGWQQAGGFFTPKSQAQIQREALLQLAILAAVVAAPALLGAGGGGGAAAGMGASAESATAITGQGASLAGSGATSSISAAALQPFIGAAALQNLVGASVGGPQALNQALQQRAPATMPGYVFDPGTVAPELDKDGRHPALPMLDNVAYGLKHSPALLQRLKLALAANRIQSMAQDRELLALVAEAAGQVGPGNPWAGGGMQANRPQKQDNVGTPRPVPESSDIQFQYLTEALEADELDFMLAMRNGLEQKIKAIVYDQDGVELEQGYRKIVDRISQLGFQSNIILGSSSDPYPMDLGGDAPLSSNFKRAGKVHAAKSKLVVGLGGRAVIDGNSSNIIDAQPRERVSQEGLGPSVSQQPYEVLYTDVPAISLLKEDVRAVRIIINRPTENRSVMILLTLDEVLWL